jgi:hypothetical protein
MVTRNVVCVVLFLLGLGHVSTLYFYRRMPFRLLVLIYISGLAGGVATRLVCLHGRKRQVNVAVALLQL